ncbi:hypothetical protein ACMGDK_11225 [Chryseobacterium sp. DT-3]|uniref:hypothetical protein n=1 Tax=Chryseobacterium sp. DT-3 TaxID=3396164 RepID=UPI003F1BB3F5
MEQKLFIHQIEFKPEESILKFTYKGKSVDIPFSDIEITITSKNTKTPLNLSKSGISRLKRSLSNNKGYKDNTREQFWTECRTIAKEKGFNESMTREFFNHWSEKDEKEIMLFQHEKTWETNLRMVKWYNNSVRWQKK